MKWYIFYFLLLSHNICGTSLPPLVFIGSGTCEEKLAGLISVISDEFKPHICLGTIFAESFLHVKTWNIQFNFKYGFYSNHCHQPPPTSGAFLSEISCFPTICSSNDQKIQLGVCVYWCTDVLKADCGYFASSKDRPSLWFGKLSDYWVQDKQILLNGGSG